MSGSQHLATNVAIDSSTSVRNIPARQQSVISPSPAMQAIGVDIVDVQRLQALYNRWQEGLLTRLFTDQEQSICRKASGYRWYSLAGRFSAKEAVKKILASRGEIAGWIEIEVLNGIYGEPYINLYGRAKLAAERLGYSRLVLSISHDANLAIATVMAYE